MTNRKILLSPFACLLAFFFATFALASPQIDGSDGLLVPPRHPVHRFLERLETLGIVDHFGVTTRPMRRSEVAEALARASHAGLGASDRALVEFYLEEFALPDSGRLVSASSNRLEHSAGGSFASAGPFVRFATTAYDGGDMTFWRDFGADACARVGRHVYVHGTVHAATQVGDRLGPPARNSPEPGVAGWTSNDTSQAYYYDTSEGYVSAAWSRGGIWLGRFRNAWGPGVRGQIALSDKAPAVPQIMVVLEPWSWLRYRFIHARLESGVIDSTTLRIPSPGEDFLRYYRKFLVSHRIDVWPHSRLRFGLSESVIYGSGGMDLGYLIPMVDLLHVQHATGGRDNVQLAADATFLWPRYTALNASFFVDEFSSSVMFDSQRNRNWIALQLGIRVTDLWGKWQGSTIRAEYTRLNPWVYEHRYPWSTFTSAGVSLLKGTVQYPLGYWLGQNADDIYFELAYDLPVRATLTFWGEQTRKGEPTTVNTMPYDLAKGYRATPFLAGTVERNQRVGITAQWSTWRHVSVEGGVTGNWQRCGSTKNTEWSANVGVQVGAW